MSSLTTTTINTINGTTDLTMMTGNSSASAIVLATDGTMKLKANSTLNAISISATSITTNTATFTSNGNFTASGNVSADNIAASANVSAVNIAVSANATVNVANVTSNSLFLGTRLLQANNGYTRLPNGLLLQWGTMAVTSSGAVITFPVTFGTVYSITATSNSTVTYPAVVSLSTSSASLDTGSATSISAYWQAIGI
jgi:hypothetical protein